MRLVGYEIAGTNGTSNVATDATYTSGSKFFVGSVNDCPDMHPLTYLAAAQGGDLFLDGLLGTTTTLNTALSNTTFQEITEPINQVTAQLNRMKYAVTALNQSNRSVSALECKIKSYSCQVRIGVKSVNHSNHPSRRFSPNITGKSV